MRKHCPRCNSTDVWWVAGGFVGNVYHCKNCGYRGAFIVECEEEEREDM